ncbi:MAG: penicillin-binding protein 2 [Hyphomonadaceae bacterium]
MTSLAGMLKAGQMSRSLITVSVFAALFVGIGLRSVSVAMSDTGAAETQRAEHLDALGRADIYDRNGELLATSVTVYSLFADPRAIWDAADVVSALTGVFPDLDTETVTARLENRERAFVWIKRGLTPRQRQAVFDLGVEGLGFRAERQRAYPRGAQAGHVLGHTNVDGRGQMGVELALDDRLRERDDPVRLSLDSGAQFALEAELNRAAKEYDISGGAGVVLHARTGEVRALASWPQFDPNRPTQANDDARLNRASGAVYELGSVFKPLTIAAALGNGRVSEGDVFDVRSELVINGFEITDTHRGAPQMSAAVVLAESSNIGTVRIAERLGDDGLAQAFGEFGLLGRAPIELPGSASPILPSAWTELSNATASYGHGIAVSPLAFARALSALANDGRLPELTLLAGEADVPQNTANGEQVSFVSEEIATRLVSMMRGAVTDGTGKRANVPGYRVAGKTGTAEKPIAGGYSEDHNVNSFAAIFPSDRPEYVVLVVLDDPRLGGGPGGTAALNAAPVAGRVIERIAPLLSVAPVFDQAAPSERASQERSAR